MYLKDSLQGGRYRLRQNHLSGYQSLKCERQLSHPYRVFLIFGVVQELLFVKLNSMVSNDEFAIAANIAVHHFLAL